MSSRLINIFGDVTYGGMVAYVNSEIGGISGSSDGTGPAPGFEEVKPVETIAEAKALTGSDNDLIWCVETETMYRYEVDGATYTPDDEKYLTTGDGGDTRWIAVTDYRRLAAGANGQVQYNDGGTQAGAVGLVWDKTNKRLGVGVDAPDACLEVSDTIEFYFNNQEDDVTLFRLHWNSAKILWLPPGDSVAIGTYAGQNLTGGYHNTPCGREAGISLTDGYGNTVIGSRAMLDSNGYNNIVIGYNAGREILGGNIVIGREALFNGATYHNVIIGTWAANSGCGWYSVVIGFNAARNGPSGNNNVIIGREAGYNATGAGCVFLGFQAGYNELASNKLYISNSDTNTPLIKGDFSTAYLGIATDPSCRLDIGNGELEMEDVGTMNTPAADNVRLGVVASGTSPNRTVALTAKFEDGTEVTLASVVV